MFNLVYKDFFQLKGESDCSRPVVEIYRSQFPELFCAADRGELKTLAGEKIVLGGDVLITYRSAIKRLHRNNFAKLDALVQSGIKKAIEAHSITAKKNIEYWRDGIGIINNHQIGNMMPFPSGIPSMNSLRASAYFDYFDKFLAEVESFYTKSTRGPPGSKLQAAIYHYRGYFDFFGSYDGFVEGNLLQDFVGRDLWGINEFPEYVRIANQLIDSRGRRFAP